VTTNRFRAHPLVSNKYFDGSNTLNPFYNRVGKIGALTELLAPGEAIAIRPRRLTSATIYCARRNGRQGTPKLINGKVWVPDPIFSGYQRLPENDPKYREILLWIDTQRFVELLDWVYNRDNLAPRNRRMSD
jgi:hypothetical protein